MSSTDIKPIPGFDGYVADSEGRIYSLKRGKPRLLGAYDVFADGWRRCTVRGPNGKPKFSTVASLIVSTFAGPRPSKAHVPYHVNGDNSDDRAANLEWKTRKEVRALWSRAYLNATEVDDLVAGLPDIVRRLRNDESLNSIARAHKLKPRSIRQLRGTLANLSRKDRLSTPRRTIVKAGIRQNGVAGTGGGMPLEKLLPT